MQKTLRRDGTGTRYLIPEDKLNEFDSILSKIEILFCDFAHEDKYFELVDEFLDKFNQYRLRSHSKPAEKK